MNTQNKRERLVDSAAQLFHGNGLNSTSLADIAKHADIPIGNVYYYFKTKEELAVAAIEKRREQFSAAYKLLDEGTDDPRIRLIEAIRYYERVRDEYTQFGCPTCRIVYDADVTKDGVAKAAAQIMADFVDWAQRQFEQLGHGETARMLAMTLIGGVQGAVLIAKTFNDPRIVTNEVERLTAWLESLPNRKIQVGKVGTKPQAA